MKLYAMVGGRRVEVTNENQLLVFGENDWIDVKIHLNQIKYSYLKKGLSLFHFLSEDNEAMIPEGCTVTIYHRKYEVDLSVGLDNFIHLSAKDELPLKEDLTFLKSEITDYEFHSLTHYNSEMTDGEVIKALCDAQEKVDLNNCETDAYGRVTIPTNIFRWDDGSYHDLPEY